MSGFRDLQKIYESAWQIGPNRGRFFTGNDSEISLSNYPGQLPAQSPGQMSPYNTGLGNSSNPIRFNEYEEDEKKEVGEKAISNLEVLSKIRDMKQQAVDDGMDYAVFTLTSLESFILSL